MRLVTALGVIAGIVALSGAIWGFDGALLAFVYSIPLVVILYGVGKSSRPRRGRLELHRVLWALARLTALFVGVAIAGWGFGLALFFLTWVLELIARMARASSESRERPD